MCVLVCVDVQVCWCESWMVILACVCVCAGLWEVCTYVHTYIRVYVSVCYDVGMS